MVVNQLFIIKPTQDLIIKIVNTFGIKDLKDNHEFSLLDMNNIETVKKLKELESDIKKYYLPCKQKIYLENWNYKTCITIARQFLKTIDYDINSREKFINNKKYLLYKLITRQEKEQDKIKKEKKTKKKEVIITFD
jgi:hypothetical protein